MNKEVHMVHGSINKDEEENLYLVSKLRIISAIFSESALTELFIKFMNSNHFFM